MPVTDAEKLYLMRCAYQRAIGCVTDDPCVDCCQKRKDFEGKKDREVVVSTFNKDTKEFKATIDPLTSQPYVDPATGLSATQANGAPVIDPSTNQYKLYITAPTLDCEKCAVSSGWLCVGSIRDVPKGIHSCVGHYKGKYVWVNKGGHDQFAKLVLDILSIAVDDPASSEVVGEKTVTYYIDEKGGLTDSKSAVGVVEATIEIGEKNKSILNERIDAEKFAQINSNEKELAEKGTRLKEVKLMLSNNKPTLIEKKANLNITVSEAGKVLERGGFKFAQSPLMILDLDEKDRKSAFDSEIQPEIDFAISGMRDAKGEVRKLELEDAALELEKARLELEIAKLKSESNAMENKLTAPPAPRRRRSNRATGGGPTTLDLNRALQNLNGSNFNQLQP
ncbi:hypothetical protein N9Y42_01690 [Mariniblastus sp.]|nr:hypothetical protein [Mariniblastus sp.]